MMQCQIYLLVNLEWESSHISSTAMMEPRIYFQYSFHLRPQYKAKSILGMLAPNWKRRHILIALTGVQQ